MACKPCTGPGPQGGLEGGHLRGPGSFSHPGWSGTKSLVLTSPEYLGALQGGGRKSAHLLQESCPASPEKGKVSSPCCKGATAFPWRWRGLAASLDPCPSIRVGCGKRCPHPRAETWGQDRTGKVAQCPAPKTGCTSILCTVGWLLSQQAQTVLHVPPPDAVLTCRWALCGLVLHPPAGP